MDESQQKTKVNKFDVEYWRNERERAIRNRWYAIGRIDLLIISISGGGIYLVFELIKYIRLEQPGINYSSIKAAGISFTIAIIVNFVSQLFGAKANRYDARFSKGKMDKVRNKEVAESEIAINQCWANFYSKAVDVCNYISIFAMLVGVIFLAVYTYFII